MKMRPVEGGLEIKPPLPATLPLFATGIGGLGLLGWRRKRKAQADERKKESGRCLQRPQGGFSTTRRAGFLTRYVGCRTEPSTSRARYLTFT
jgi:hypothetical protein